MSADPARGEPARPRLLPAPLPDARESDDAGQYYCAHALFVGHLAVERGRAPLARDDEGDPLIGFLHVPPDARTLQGAAEDVVSEDRHRETRQVVAAALAGFAHELVRSVPDGPLHIVVTGFGSFRDVVDNPTGAFVRSPADVRHALDLAFGDKLSSCAAGGDGSVRATMLIGSARRELMVHLVSLPVDDRCLALLGDHSLLASLERERAHAWLGLGVCRSSYYRVETLPHDGGLQLDDEGGRHVKDLAPRRFPRGSRALVRALERGGDVVARHLVR